VSATSSIFVSRIKGLPMLDANGDQVGKVRDVVIQNRTSRRPPKVKGLVVDLFAHRRIFFPMERVRSIDPNQVIISGLVNTRRFEARDREVLVAAQLFDRTVQRVDSQFPETIYDVAIRNVRAREWELAEVALRQGGHRPFGRTHVTIFDWSDVPDFIDNPGLQDAEQQVMRLSELKAADVARELHDMDATLRAAVVEARTTSAWPRPSRNSRRTSRSPSSTPWTPNGSPTSWRRWTPTTRPT